MRRCTLQSTTGQAKKETIRANEIERHWIEYLAASTWITFLNWEAGKIDKNHWLDLRLYIYI